MLIKKFHEEHEDGVKFYIISSDDNKCILQKETNTLYAEVCITEDDLYTYEETDIPIEEEYITNNKQ